MKDCPNRKILAICGSTRQNSVNHLVLKTLVELSADIWEMEVYEEINQLPFFNQDMDGEQPPARVHAFRNKISEADGVVICTPEYVFSLPGVLKNAIEWTVSTTVFSKKPVALITASSSGQKAQEALLLIMKAIYAQATEEDSLLISGAKAKVKSTIAESDNNTIEELKQLVIYFDERLKKGL